VGIVRTTGNIHLTEKYKTYQEVAVQMTVMSTRQRKFKWGLSDSDKLCHGRQKDGEGTLWHVRKHGKARAGENTTRVTVSSFAQGPKGDEDKGARLK